MSFITITLKMNNIKHGKGEEITINVNDTFQNIMKKICNKIGIDAKMIFNENGARIGDAKCIHENESIYVSRGEPFYRRPKGKPAIVPKIKKTIKICLIGSSCCGKTSFVIRYVKNYFRTEYLPTIEDHHEKSIRIGNKEIILDILDTSGMDEYVVMRYDWYKECESFIMMYSISHRETFSKVQKLYDELKGYKTENFDQLRSKNGKSINIVLVGSGSDLGSKRKVSEAEGMVLAKRWGAEFFEASAKTNTNVDQVFETLAKMTYYKEHPELNPKTGKDQCIAF